MMRARKGEEITWFLYFSLNTFWIDGQFLFSEMSIVSTFKSTFKSSKSFRLARSEYKHFDLFLSRMTMTLVVTLVVTHVTNLPGG
jgi:hypothetical protein